MSFMRTSFLTNMIAIISFNTGHRSQDIVTNSFVQHAARSRWKSSPQFTGVAFATPSFLVKLKVQLRILMEFQLLEWESMLKFLHVCFLVSIDFKHIQLSWLRSIKI